ncbi:MAG TPA: PDZ domain-containing protein [Calditrichia bacterium]|nr:PDZ domain-containing protein [Calditrichia bacterium]
MTRIYLPLLVLILFSTQLISAIHYQVSWPRPHTHYFEVTVTVDQLRGKETQIRIPAWRPGRYFMQNFVRNVVGAAARDEKGNPLSCIQADQNTWQIAHNGAKKVVFSYRYYAPDLDAGNSYVDDAQALLNPIALLVYLPGREREPCRLSLSLPDNWLSYSALRGSGEKGRYEASDYYELADSPILATPSAKNFRFTSHGQTVEGVVQGGFPEDQLPRIKGILKDITDEQGALFGGLPFERFLFILEFVPRPRGHGVEHRNSTVMVIGPNSGPAGRLASRIASLGAHEFFHVWNVERIAPENLLHPDYSTPQYTRDMWFYEGGTSYFGDLSLVRSGLISREFYWGQAARLIARNLNNPADSVTSAALASFNAWGKDDHYPPHTETSYYTKGEFLTFLIDAKLRGASDGQVSLDQVFRSLWQNYGKSGRGVPAGELRRELEKVSGQSFADFFARYVDGLEKPPVAEILAGIGLTVEIGDSEDPYLGIELENGDLGRIAALLPGSPGERGGLSAGDILLALNDQRVTRDNYREILAEYHPGDQVRATFFRREQLREATLTVVRDPVRKVEVAPSEDQTARIREDWLKPLFNPGMAD